MDRDAIRDAALEDFGRLVGEYREHQLVREGLTNLRDKYFEWLKSETRVLAAKKARTSLVTKAKAKIEGRMKEMDQRREG